MKRRNEATAPPLLQREYPEPPNKCKPCVCPSPLFLPLSLKSKRKDSKNILFDERQTIMIDEIMPLVERVTRGVHSSFFFENPAIDRLIFNLLHQIYTLQKIVSEHHSQLQTLSKV